ncbi:hypothetical protein CROQUDRAFT_41598 [Cronartium quercuum f. sp. fusiforme G11]|uniref:Uncharacterized protein n=1 Tax=Cronartium quercuum f. sp. fusiforme G11 TaxID=708437 RepID=A0A9P6TDB8_9BASI|nr:hypothetical protein CROQUDRAFT_41598 [Cronartium quercuum f. sp. fusiforme G11]
MRDQPKLRPASLAVDSASAKKASASRRQRLVDVGVARERARIAHSKRAATDKARFDARVAEKGTFQLYRVGETIKLRNETRTKGQPCWYGPFEVFDCLGQNVYRLIEPSGSLFPHLVKGNRLQPAKAKRGKLTEPWALPKRLQPRAAAEERVDKLKQAEAVHLTRAQIKAARSRIRIIGRFAPDGTAPSLGGGMVVAGLQAARSKGYSSVDGGRIHLECR